MVQVVFAGIQCLHDLADHEERRVAGVVVDIFEAEINCPAVVVGQDDQVVSAGPHGGLDELKVDRRHLRAQDRIVFAHLRCKRHFFDCR